MSRCKIDIPIKNVTSGFSFNVAITLGCKRQNILKSLFRMENHLSLIGNPFPLYFTKAR